MPDFSWTTTDALLLAMLGAIGIWLRLYRLAAQGHRYYDEGLYYVRALYQYELLRFVLKNFRGLLRGSTNLNNIFSKTEQGWYPRNANYQLHEWCIALLMGIFGRRPAISLYLSALFGILALFVVPVLAGCVAGQGAFGLALILMSVDAANVYYSRTAFGDTQAAFFLVLGLFCLWAGFDGSYILVLLAGLFCCCCLMCKTQYYFMILAVELCLVVTVPGRELWSTGIVAFIVFNLGLMLPILFIEGFYRILKHWGYEQQTYLQLVYHQYFNITRAGDDYETRSSYRREIPWFRWRWLQMFWRIQNPFYCLLLVVAVIVSLFSGQGFLYGLLFVSIIPVLNWLRHEFCALRYLFSNHLLLVALMALSLGPYVQGWGLVLLGLLLLGVGIYWDRKYFEVSAHLQSYKYLTTIADKIYSADFYNAQIFFPRHAVRYAPGSLDELKTLYDEGFSHWLVDLHSTFALTDGQEQVLDFVEKMLIPVCELEDESIVRPHFWWEYCYSKLVNHKYERCFRDAPKQNRTIRIYDLEPLVKG